MPSLMWTELAEVHGCEGGELDTHIGGQGVALRPVLGAGPSTEQILQIWSDLLRVRDLDDVRQGAENVLRLKYFLQIHSTLFPQNYSRCH